MLCLHQSCEICGTGNLGLRICDDDQTIVVMCDECDALWSDPRRIDAASALYPKPPLFAVPGRIISVAHPRSRWASRAELEQAGLLGFVEVEGTASDGR